MKSRVIWSFVVAGVFALSCSDDPLGPVFGAPASLIIVSGDVQEGFAGEELPAPLVVEVTDSLDQPIPQQLINFVVTSGGGSVFAGAALTNAQGRAQERWTLGPIVGDTQRLQARAVDPNSGAPLVFASFRAVAARGPAETSGPWRAVTVASSHSCALVASGAAYCWGQNNNGKLGVGADLSSRFTPTAVVGGLTFASISAGGHNTCGLTAAGVAYCWGADDRGQTGTGGASGPCTGIPRQCTAPAQVAGGHLFSSIAVGSTHTCAIRTDGATMCWGYRGNSNAMGTGPTLPASCVTPPPQDDLPYCPVPVLVTGGHVFTRLASGSGVTCGLTASNAAHCWGSFSGAPGPGTGLPASDVPTAVSGSLTFSGIAVGGAHACGVTPAGAAYCWGSNQDGQTGTGVESLSTPQPVTGGLTFATVATDWRTTCARQTGGATYCWGLNEQGYVGDSTSISPRTAPRLVVGKWSFAEIDVGSFVSCGRTSGGALLCWGSGAQGILGNDNNQNFPYPVKVANP